MLQDKKSRAQAVSFEELPPPDELAAVSEAMAGLAQMGAVVQSLRKACEGEGEAGEDQVEDSDPQDLG